jgi:hypothetical protein
MAKAIDQGWKAVTIEPPYVPPTIPWDSLTKSLRQLEEITNHHKAMLRGVGSVLDVGGAGGARAAELWQSMAKEIAQVTAAQAIQMDAARLFRDADVALKRAMGVRQALSVKKPVESK